MTNTLLDPSVFTELRFATPPIEKFANTLRQWFGAAIIGGLIYGPSRAGKSYAIEYVKQKRSDIFGYDIPIILMQWKKPIIKEKDFHERFLRACGHSLPSDRTSNRELETRLVEYLATLAANSGRSCLIVFIDEAQYLRLDDLSFLANIYNRLKDKKIQQFTFLVGERKLTGLRGKAITDGEERYVGRFMCADFEFPLLKSARDLAVVLKQYDTTDYPEGSGKTIIQRFLPKASAKGWKFENQSKQIWQEFRCSARSVGKKTSSMKMQSCTQIVAQLLQALSKRDTNNLSIKKEDIEKATELVKYLHNT